ncbi:MAG: serine hydrolase domain-containing protein [Pseudomonadota bacterium]
MTLRSVIEARPDVEALMVEFLAVTGAPGVLVGLQVANDPPLLLAEGIDDLNTGDPLMADRVFRIGSVTKPIVAAVTLAAVQEGRLSLDDTLDEFFPGVTNGQATLAQILAHDAGLSDWDAIPGGIRTLLFSDPNRDWQPEEIVAEVGELPAYSAPGSGFHYSNPGYQMLGALLEQVQQASMASLIERTLIAPFDLADTLLGPPDSTPDKLIHGFGDLGGTLIDNQVLSAVGIDTLFYTTGAGYSDLDDLLRFCRLYWGSAMTLAPEGVDVAEDRSGNYGFATQYFSDQVFGHTGDIIGARTAAGHHRALDISVVVHVNTNVIERQPTVDLALAVIDTLLAQE